MNVEQLLLVLPQHRGEATGPDLTIRRWSTIVEEFAEQGGSEVLLGGPEPLAFPGFWPLARLRAGALRVTAFLSGSLLEPWVLRELLESGIHFLVALDSPGAEPHDAVRRPGAHARAVGAIDTLLAQGLAPRLGILATATRLNHGSLPELAGWAADRGLARMAWTFVPEGGWPAPQLKALQLTADEAGTLAGSMATAARSLAGRCHVGPLDPALDPTLGSGLTRLLRVTAQGDAVWGLSADGSRLGNLRWATLKDLLDRASQAAGD